MVASSELELLRFEPLSGVPVSPDAIALARLAYSGQPLVPDHFLTEWTPYRLHVAGADALQIGSVEQAPLVAGTGVFELLFQNQLGIARIQPLRDGRLHGAGTIVEVIAQKFVTPLESIRFTEALLVDLFSRQAPLPYAVAAPTGRLVREARRPPNLLFAWHFFRRHAHDLQHAVQTIGHHPLRRLSEVREDVPLPEAGDVDLDAMLSVLQRATRNGPPSLPIVQRLQPDRVTQRRPIETLDIPENRFALDVARRLAASVEDVLRWSWLASRKEVVPESERQRLVTLRNALRTFVRDRRFAEVGAMTRIPVESRVLQRRDGYRELTHLWFAFQRARQPMFDRLQHAIDLRDIATLYEYWVFFELVEQIGTALGVDGVLDPIHGDGLDQAMRCTFGVLGTLHYNATKRGYSGVNLRPDSLWVPTEGAMVAFDAKFRMTKQNSAIVPDLAGSSYAAKDDDLVKMHAYRDALSVRAAVVLYPGSIATLRPVIGPSTPRLTVAEVIQDATLHGVGEIGLSPLTMGDVP